MKILKLSEQQIESMRIDTTIKYITKAQVKICSFLNLTLGKISHHKVNVFSFNKHVDVTLTN